MIFNLVIFVAIFMSLIQNGIANTTSNDENIFAIIGYLADIYCMDLKIGLDGSDMIRSPQDHLVGCLLEPPCKASGYAVITNTAPTSSPEKNYEIKYKFDAPGNKRTVNFLLGLQAKGVSKDVRVKAVGSLVSGNTMKIYSILLAKHDCDFKRKDNCLKKSICQWNSDSKVCEVKPQ